MRSHLACSLIGLLLSIAGSAFAQPSPAGSSSNPQAPAAAPAIPSQGTAQNTPLPPPPPALPALPPPPAPPSDAFTCAVGDHAGVDPVDAGTVTQILCGEIASRQAPAGAIYVVHLRRLGRSVVLSLEQRDGAGRVLGQRQATLQSIEEAPIAAPRIAESMLSGVALANTQRVDNLLGQETREQKRKWGATYYGIGVGGTAFPGGVGLVAPAFDLSLYHETERLAVGGDFRFSMEDSSSGDKDVSFEALSVGARYFTSSDDVTPFVGGGLAWSGMQMEDGGWYGEGSGFSFYAEGGVEALRLHKTRLVVGVRATLPVYQVAEDDYYFPGGSPASSDSAAAAPPEQEKRYVVPVSLTATFLF